MSGIKLRRRKLHPAEQYAKDVIDKKIITGRFVRLACKRYFDDRQNGSKRGLLFNRKYAQHAIDFFQFLKHWKGEWFGQRFTLEPWEQFFIWNIFGWVDKSGFRRFRTVYLEVGRKNGKTTLLAGIGLYMLCADEEPGAEIYSAATKREQALISHEAATKMVQASAHLKKIIGVYRNNLHVESSASKFEPLGRDSDSSDGLNVHGALIDELHAHKTRDMWDVLETATGSRRQPILISITTAGFDRTSICWEQHEYLEKILEGVIQDDTYFGLIYAIDKNDDWKNESNWYKSNPNLGISCSLEDLQRKALKAKEMPSALNNFLRKHLDVWVQQESRWIDIDLWNNNFYKPVVEKELFGRKCYGGLDLASVSDLAAWVMIFPYPDNNDMVDVIARFWCPEARLYDKHNRFRHQYEAWHRDGWLNTTTGDAIDYTKIKEQILIDAKHFELYDMGVDRLFQGYQLMMELSSEMGKRNTNGVQEERVAACGMGFKTMGPAMRELESRLLKRQINHGNNPILKWMADNVSVDEDAAGNKKPNKAASQGKIDGIVSLLMAIDRQMRKPVFKSKYETQSLLVI